MLRQRPLFNTPPTDTQSSMPPPASDQYGWTQWTGWPTWPYYPNYYQPVPPLPQSQSAWHTPPPPSSSWFPSSWSAPPPPPPPPPSRSAQSAPAASSSRAREWRLRKMEDEDEACRLRGEPPKRDTRSVSSAVINVATLKPPTLGTHS